MKSTIPFRKDFGNLKRIFFYPKGRLSRRQFVLSSVFLLILILTFSISTIYILIINPTFFYILFFIFWSFMVYVLTIMSIKRFHDFGLKGKNIFWFLVPFLNIYFAFKLLLEKGEKKNNKYGEAIIHYHKITKRYAFLGIGIMVLTTIFMFIVAIFFTLRSSTAYHLTESTLYNMPKLEKKYGEFELGIFPQGNIFIKNDKGIANFKIKIYGKNENGNKKIGFVFVKLIKDNYNRQIVDIQF